MCKRDFKKYLSLLSTFLFEFNSYSCSIFLALVQSGSASRRYTNMCLLSLMHACCMSLTPHHYNYSFLLATKIGRPNLHLALSRSSNKTGENFLDESENAPRPNTPKANKEPVVVSDMDAGPAGSTRRACVHRNKSIYERKRRAALVSVRVSECGCGWMSDLMILAS